MDTLCSISKFCLRLGARALRAATLGPEGGVSSMQNLLTIYIPPAGKNEQLSALSSLSLTLFDTTLPAPTLTAGECKMSGDESKVSRRVNLLRNICAPRSKPKMTFL